MKKIIDLSIICACFLLLLLCFESCAKDKDLFDPEAYNEELQDKFPVKNIGSNQTWQTIGSVSANVTVNEDKGESYTVKFYSENPINNDSAVLLAKQTIASGSTWTGSIDYALSDSTLYVTCVDKRARREVMPVKINNGTISACFGSPLASTKSRAISRASGDQYPITTMEAPYSESDIESMLQKASEINSVKDYDIMNNGKNISNYYKINGNFNGAILDDSPVAGTKLIVCGTWTLPANFSIQKGLEVIIADGGSIVIPSGVILYSHSSSGSLTVLKGGTLSGKGTANIDSGGLLYNGGTTELTKLIFDSKSVLYNADGATLNVGTLTLNSATKLINRSSNCTIDLVDNYNSVVYNACKMSVNTLNTNEMIIGSSASIQCKDLIMTGTAKLNPNALLSVTNSTKLNGVSLSGPTDGTNYAVCSFGNIISGYASTISNYLYVEAISYPKTAWWWTTGNVWSNSAVLVDSGCAKLNVDSSDCTIGYTSSATGGDKTDTKNFSTSYAFEDNYPRTGDYDFNDLVLKIARTADENVVVLKVTIAAIGATRQLGAGIRLYGITSKDITSISTDNAFNATFGSLMPRANNGYLNSIDTYKSVVIPLFDDAHYALSGSKDRVFYNTNRSSSIATKTLTVTITARSADVASKIEASSIDPFITYGGEIEVHTYAWKSIAALGSIVNADTKKYIWAIAVPDFNYPLEGVPITTAYPKFESWAADMTTNTDWYKSPVSGDIY